jgi:CcmD family protein
MNFSFKTGLRKKLTFLSGLLLYSFNLFAQESGQKIEMADLMRSSGKIYVVVGVLLIIFAGITLYLVTMDRKLSKLEKKVKERE